MTSKPARQAGRGALAVFAPSPVLAVTVDSGGASPDLHVHAAGQGFWVARMAAELGADVTLCCPLGGETGHVLRGLIEGCGITVSAVEVADANGSYIHDEHDGHRAVLRRIPSARMDRHEADDLYDLTLTAALDADALLLTGPREPDLVAGDHYRRLSQDVARASIPVLGDLTGPALAGALAGGVELLKLGDDEAVDEGFSKSRRPTDIVAALYRIRIAGARNVLISRGPKGALALVGDEVLQLSAPRIAPAEARGTGDSMFGAIGVGIAAHRDWIDALRLGVAAGALNATRHGLGSGHHGEIEHLLGRVRVQRLDDTQDGWREAGSEPRPGPAVVRPPAW